MASSLGASGWPDWPQCLRSSRHRCGTATARASGGPPRETRRRSRTRRRWILPAARKSPVSSTRTAATTSTRRRAPCSTVGGVAVFNCLRNFEVAHNSFSLNLAEVALEKKPTADSRGGFRIDLDYGPTATIVHGSEPGGTASFRTSSRPTSAIWRWRERRLQLDFGKFVTPMGNEVIETKDNWNYGRSLLFTLAIPSYHTGARRLLLAQSTQ